MPVHPGGRLLLVFGVVFAALLPACSGGGRPAPPSARGCPPVHPKRPSSGALSAFFPLKRAALWLGKGPCVYLVGRTVAETRLLWRGRKAELVRGLAWSPDGENIAITTKSTHDGWRVVILRRDGALGQRLQATGVAFLRDGRLVVSRRGAIYLRSGTRLATDVELQRVAGFRLRTAIAVSPDPLGYGRGYGRGGVALTLWGGPAQSKSAVLAVSASGKVARASPAYRAGGGEGSVLGWTWSPDGGQVFVTAEVVPPNWHGPGDHDHCIDVWSAERGRSRAFCGSELPSAYRSHFARLVWAVDGKRMLLDNGTVLTRDGRVVGRLEVPASAFELLWQPAAT